jgi:tetratricopeptide (TPR) repeat protein
MKMTALIVFAFLGVLFLGGCVSNPINAKTGAHYYEAGMQAERNGDFTLARQNYSRAYANAQIGNLGPVAEAYSMYEWSRVTGYLGMYADAEKGFEDVLILINQADGKADNLKPPALGELARLLHDTNQHEKAVPVYEKAVSELDKRDVVKVDPIGFALVLDDYSQSLKVAGFVSKADEVATRAQSIRDANKGANAKFVGKRYKNP